MARKPNKRQRKLRRNRERRKRLASVPESARDDERRPVGGLDNLYEVTRAGYLYSKRHGRFIQHKANPQTGRRWIGVSIGGEERTMGIGEAVADAWMTEDERAALAADLEDRKLEDATVREMCQKHGAPRSAVYHIAHNRARYLSGN